MKISNDQIESLVKELAGGDVLPLFRILKLRRNMNEFLLADKLQTTVNQVRNKLYKMQEHNLVTSVRRKDKKKGWYVYYWTFNKKEVSRLYLEYKQKKLKYLKKELKKKQEENLTFICPNKCYKFDIEKAMEINFKCPECGEVLKEENKKIHIRNTKKEINLIEKELNVKK